MKVPFDKTAGRHGFELRVAGQRSGRKALHPTVEGKAGSSVSQEAGTE